MNDKQVKNEECKLNNEELKDVSGGIRTPIRPVKSEDIKPIEIDPSPTFIRKDI